MSAFAAQTRNELVLSLRQGEQLLVALGIPVLLLVFLSQVDFLPTAGEPPLDYLTPAMMALAVMSSAMVGLGIGTGFERHYGVLKRLGATPLGRPRLLGAKVAATLVTEVVQVVLLVTVAIALGWDASWRPQWLVPAVLLGTATFAGIGLLLAGTLSGPANLAACNGLYLSLLLLGGVAVPAEDLPGPLTAVASLLPTGALVDVMRAATGGDPSAGAPLAVLAGWALITPMAAALTFRWSPRD
jgi:ABC-2 type transport system permease protein